MIELNLKKSVILSNLPNGYFAFQILFFLCFCLHRVRSKWLNRATNILNIWRFGVAVQIIRKNKLAFGNNRIRNIKTILIRA